MAQALSLIHPIDDQRAAQAKKEWTRTPFREVANTTWLIVGFGPIGSTTAARAKAFGATVNVIRRSPQTSEIVDAAGTMDDLERFLPNADVIVLACPLNDATRGFAGEAFFANIKQGAILINIARGALIDDSAMIAALDRGQLEAAALDVFHTEPLPADDPLWGHQDSRHRAHFLRRRRNALALGRAFLRQSSPLRPGRAVDVRSGAVRYRLTRDRGAAMA